MITAPIRLTGSVHPQQLASVIAIDAYLRRQAQLSLSPLPFCLTTIAGDVATQTAVRKAVVREGEDRDELGREAFAERAERLTAEAHGDLKTLLASLNAPVDVDSWVAGAPEAVRAARVAFVRLYEAGLLRRTEGVVDSCPSCETVIDVADVDEVEMDFVHLRLRLTTANGEIEIDVAEPELLVGAVAIAVPPEHGAAGDSVFLPLLDAEVPIVPVEGADRPAMVVPGHFQWAHEVARQIGARTVQVLDGEGVVRHPGALEGLSRYAARTAATEALAMDGVVVARFEEKIPVRRCHRCGTVLVSLRGRHWVIDMNSITQPVLHQLHAGELRFAPEAALEQMTEVASRATTWCVSQQLWSGELIPSLTCLDCNQTTVVVDAPDSCPTCMGTLVQDEEVLDARFIAAMAPLAMTGWPAAFDNDLARDTCLAVGRYGLDVWALPMAALGLRLAGAVPFVEVIVHQFAIGAPEVGQRRITDEIAHVSAVGSRVARAALISGDFDTERAAESVAVLDDPVEGATPFEQVAAAYDTELSTLDPGEAFLILVNAARAGISSDDRQRLATLAQPLLGS